MRRFPTLTNPQEINTPRRMSAIRCCAQRRRGPHCLAHILIIAFLIVLAVPVGAEAKPGYELHASGTELILPVEKNTDYVIAVLANERQRVQLVVKRPSSTTEYSTKGHVTDRSIEADFGGFGRINVRLHLVRHPPDPPHMGRCKGLAPLYQEGTYQGSIEFSSQGDVPEVSIERGHVYFEHKFRQICEQPRQVGGDKPGTSAHTVEVGILTIAGRTQGRTIFLQAFNFASARNPGHSAGYLNLAAHERRQGVRITQRISASIDHDSFAMGPRDRIKETVEIAPPEPFSGYARYTRSPDASPSLTGDLTVDLPDGNSIPLVDAGLAVVFCRGFSIDPLRRCLYRSEPGFYRRRW
jgi:hypothetical protein